MSTQRFIKTDLGYSYRRKKNFGGGVVARCDTCNKFVSWDLIRYGFPIIGVCHKNWARL